MLAANQITRRIGILAVTVAMAATLAGCYESSSGSFSRSAAIPAPAAPAAPAARPASPTSVTGYAVVTWTAPTQNVDGSPLTNLAGYKVRYGQSVSNLTQTVDIPNSGATTTRIEGLSVGTWYFTVAAYTNVGVESSPSDAASKTIYSTAG